MDQNLGPTQFTNSNSFGAAAVSLYTGQGWLLGDTTYSVLDYTTWIETFQYLTATKHTDPDSVYPPLVSWNQFLSAALFTDVDNYGSPRITQIVSPLRIPSTNAFGTPRITLVVLPAKYTDADGFKSHTITVGTRTLTATVYADPDGFGAAVVGYDQTLTATLYADGDSFGAHAALNDGDLRATLYVNPDGFGAPVVANVGSARISQVIGHADTTLLRGVELAQALAMLEIKIGDRPLRVSNVMTYGEVTLVFDLRFTQSLAMGEVTLPYDMRFTQSLAMGEVTLPFDMRFTQALAMAELSHGYFGEEAAVSGFVWMM